jgi:DNA-binding CsgD family transcriptional regulator
VATEVHTGRRPSPSDKLLEREPEFAAVVELFERAAGGRGGCVLFEGPAGVGKSALLERAAGLARERGLVVLRARGHELERAFGWGVARALLEAWLVAVEGCEREDVFDGPARAARVLFERGEEAAGAPATEAGFAILHALYWLVVRRAESAPVLVLVDDAQWVDEPSLRFLVYLLGRLPDQPIALLVAARVGERGEGGLLELLAGDAVADVRTLAPLSAAAVARLVRQRVAGVQDGFCRRCFELTGGNPLQVRELLTAIEQQERTVDAVALEAAAELAARSLGRSVLRRLSVLSADARALARAVAVLEDDAPLALAGALVPLAPAAALGAADELARAEVLRAGDPLGFTHPLVRAAVYGQLAFGERAQTHRRAARLLAEMGAASERVSAHLLESPAAGDKVVVDVLRASARRASAQGVPGSAVSYLERALREPPADTERAAVLSELARAEAAAGRPGAVSHLEAAIALVAAPQQRAALLLELGRALHDGGRLAEAGACFRRGLEEIGDRASRDRSELALDLEAGYLTSAMLAPGLAVDAHRRVDALLASDVLLRSRAGRALASKAMIMRLFADGRRDEVVAVAHRLLADGRLIEEDSADSQARSHVIGCLSWCDDYEAAEGALQLSFADARRRGSVLTFAMASQLRARQRLWTGAVGDAVADARVADDIWRQGRHMYVHASTYCLVSGLLELDQPDAAERVLALGDHRPVAEGFFAAWRHTALGRLAAHRGDHAAALEAFLATGRRLGELLAVNPTVLPWRSEAGLAARRLGREQQACELIGEELALAERFGAPRALGVARRASGLLERGEAAVEQLRSSAELLAGCRARVEQTRALIDLGAAIRRAGRPIDARGTLRQALVLADGIGATALAQRCRDESRLAGARPPRPSAPVRGGGLTPSEHRVAELAARGESNRQIADALFVTVKSVEWHLGNVYRKLDIRGRAELAAALEVADPA